MELPFCTESNEEIDLVPILLRIDKDDEGNEIAPSSFMAQMKLSTEERLEKLRKSQQKFNIKPELTFNVFSVTPDIVIFQNFKPGTIYTTPLTIRNVQNVPKPLKGIFTPSPYFSVSHASETTPTYLAPGMSTAFNVRFCADDIKDYKYKLIFLTEGKTFHVPVIAIGSRPLLDFPDHINLPNAPIKLGSQKMILVRNLGQVPAVFGIHTKLPFLVNPTKGVLLPDKDMQLIIDFKPTILGTSKGYLIVTYESGEKLSIKLTGFGENLNIHLEKGALRFFKTFMSLSRQKSIKLYNNSKHIVKFQWKQYISLAAEEERFKKIKQSLLYLRDNETIKDNKLVTYDIIDGSGHSKICNRIYQDELEELANQDKFLYQNKNFQIIPVTGEIWPETMLEVLIIFSPSEACAYSSTAYLDVSGRNERLKLILNGMGAGPRVFLNIETLNANVICMCARHQYEVAAINKGHIPATVVYKPKTPEFGGTFKCWPAQIELNPDECGAFVLEFSSRQQGKFLETIEFEIAESKEIIKFVFMGEIICPLLSVNVSEIDFGKVAIAYPTNKSITLHNSSTVPIEYSIEVSDDGYIPSIGYEEIASLPTKCGPYANPREFDVIPRCGTVPPHSELDVEIILKANIVRERTTKLSIRMWGTDKYTIVLGIKYKACVPNIICVPDEINIKFCFVTYPYTRLLTLHNKSNVPGYFQIVSSTEEIKSAISLTTSINEGTIKPKGEVEIDVTVTTRFLGEDSMAVFIKLFGDQPRKVCTITCVGQGPVVTANPDKLDFGNVTLLNVTTKELTITNDSPIAAVAALRVSPKSLFTIETNALEMQPEESIILNVSVYLCNPGTFRDKLYISVENGSETVCAISATGTGTSILCEPKIHPVLNVGTFLTYKRFSLDVKFTNKGFRSHRLIWSHCKNPKSKGDPDADFQWIFKILPYTCDLEHKESIEASVDGFTKQPGLVKETFYCNAMVEKSKKQAIIITLNVLANFVEPTVILSKTDLKFRQDVGPENTVEFLIDEVIITNITNLPIEMNISLSPPFYLLADSEDTPQTYMYSALQNEESVRILVGFDPYTADKNCFTVHDQLKIEYEHHPKVNLISLYGEVNYPHIEIKPNFIKFPCVIKNTSEHCQVLLRNVGPLPVTYHFEWQEDSITVDNLYSIEALVPIHQIDSTFSRSSSDSGSYLRELEMKALEANAHTTSNVELVKLSSRTETAMHASGANLEMLNDTEDASLNKLPIENVYYKTQLEKNPSYHYIQIEEEVKPIVRMSEALSLPQRNKEYALAMRAILSETLTEFTDEDLDSEVIKTLPRDKTLKEDITSVIDVAPMNGFLKPYESQVVSIDFHPTTNISVSVQAKCHVVGGMTETLDLTAMSSDISYAINETYVDFGRQIFCNLSEKIIVLKNIGYREFEFVTSAKEFPNPIPVHLILEAGCLTVTPKRGLLKPDGIVELKILYFPGIAGEFDEKFSIEIGYLPPISISVHGYGVFPQLYLYLPRPDFSSYNTSLAYLAVASITPDYLMSLKNVKSVKQYLTKEHVYCEDIPKSVRQKLKKEGWVIISYNDLFPTIMDIDLAIERMILYQKIYEDQSILTQHTKAHKALIIPNFEAPLYLVDFGYVILDTSVHYTVLIFNYGPVNAEVKPGAFHGKKTKPDPSGLAIQFRRTTINVGDTKELFVIFHPTIENYYNLDYEISHIFYLDVGHGPRIPIEVRAIITVPTIIPKCTFLEFGEVRCGNCLKKPLILYNDGHLISEWNAIIQRYNKKQGKGLSDQIRKKPVFFLNDSRGILEPGSCCVLDVYFEPQYEGYVEWNVAIIINQNPNRVVVTLKGLGIKPTLRFEQEVVEFDPVLPYARKCEKVFTIENISSFPIEFYFADYDTEINEEEKVINLLTYLYRRNDMYIPPRKPGSKLPNGFSEFYYKTLEGLKEKLIKAEQQRQLKLLSKEDLACERRGSGRRGSNTSGRRLTTPSVSMIEVADPLLTKTPEEIETLLKEYIDDYVLCLNLQKEPTNGTDRYKSLDPLHTVISESKTPLVENDATELREGVFIIFHGAPNTNTHQAANKAALEVGLPIYSIDELFIESLVANGTLAAITVNEIIDEAFNKVASETDLLKGEDVGMYDEMQNKIDLLLSGKEKKPKETPKASGKSSEKSSKKSKESSKASAKKPKVDTRPTFMGIQEDLLFEILKQRMSLFRTGVIIESLCSIFLRQPIVALNVVLKAIGNVQYINCVILSHTLEENMVYRENLKKLEEDRIQQEQEAILKKIYESNQDVSTLSPEEYNTFKELVLNDRKLKTLAKREELKIRLLERKSRRGKPSGKDSKKSKVAIEKKPTPNQATSAKNKGESDKKSKDSSKKGGKKKEKVKLSPEELLLKQQFDTFESDLQLMLHMLEHWDRKGGMSLQPLPVKGKGKGSAGKKPSSRGSGKKPKQSSKTSILKFGAESVPLTFEQELKLKQTGIPCWLLTNAHVDKPVEETISKYFCYTPELKYALQSLEESLIEKIEEVVESFTVLNTVTGTRTRNLSPYFYLKDDEMPYGFPGDLIKSIKEENYHTMDDESLRRDRHESKSSLIFRTKRRKRSLEKHRGGKQSSISIAHNATDGSSEHSTVDTDSSFTTRMLINPGEKIRFKVGFKPDVIGNYEHTFTIEMIGWPLKHYLVCKGSCGIPALDMRSERIFAKIVKKRSKKDMYLNNLFSEEDDIFDFGPLLYQDKNEQKLSAETEFFFTNSSFLPCEVSFCFRDDTDSYLYDPNVLMIPPNATDILRISALPALNKCADNQLVISIKNNPKVETINLTSETCKLEFSVTPTSINFERILINRVETKSYCLENETLVPINWKLTCSGEFLKHFGLSQSMGYIPAKTTHEIFVTYASEVIQEVPKQKLYIDVYDKDCKLGTPLYRSLLDVSAEAIEVTIECLKELRLDEIKARLELTVPYTMLSQGKYNLEFYFTDILEDQDPLFDEHKALRSYFKVIPDEGVLQYNKPELTNIIFYSMKTIEFYDVPIFNCTFIDPLHKNVIETFPLKAYGKTFLSSYEICPPDKVNFGHQLIGTEKMQEITITNNGKFEFSYEVMSLSKILEMKEKALKGKDKKDKGDKGSSTKKGGKSDKTGSTNKSDKKTVKITTLSVGIFSLVSSTGIIQPNEICKIQISAKPNVEGLFEEPLMFFMSECCPADKDGYRFDLSVLGCGAIVNFKDLDGIFREQYIVNRIVDFESPKEKDTYCVFVKEETRLHFSNVIINNKGTARIRLENIGPVTAEITTAIRSVGGNVFSVDPKKLNMEAHSTNYMTIIFEPNALDTFTGVLTITNECSSSTVPNKLLVNLSGEGLVPEIALRIPEFDNNAELYMININPIFVGTATHRIINFENTGIISCQTVIEVCEDPIDAFTLIPHDNTLPFVKLHEKAETAHFNIAKLRPGEQGTFELHFTSFSTGCFNCLVKLHLVNNPFENITIFVTAEVYNQDVTIDGLITASIRQDDTFFSNPGYELDFGSSFINTLQKKCFKITNNSPFVTYKFDITNCDKIMFIPAVGHLKPLAVKEIFATFLSKEPITLHKEVLECVIFQIEYLNPELEPLSWDDRQDVVVWEPMLYATIAKPRSNSSTPLQTSPSRQNSPATNEANVKTIRNKSEPAVDMVPGTYKCIPILFSVVCDYSSYECNEQHIEINDTLAFEKSSYTFEITNTSNILLDLTWHISMDESYPKRINSAVPNGSTNFDFLKRESYHSYRVTHSANHTSASCMQGGRLQRPIHLTGYETFVSTEASPVLSKSSLFSSEANMTNRSNDSWLECDFLPFTVTPRSVAIQPKETKAFKVTFTPKDVFSYLVHLRSEITNLLPSSKHLDITIKARSLLPLYHFDIAPSDYLTVKRKGKKFCRDLADENTRVVEIEGIGLGITVERTFNIINPTGESFSYKWIPADICGNNISLFYCHKPEGQVEKGKMGQATFSFLPQTTGTFEAFYRFYIPKYNLSRAFLLVGIAREPNILFSCPHLQMKPTVVGIDITKTVCIKNNEDFEVDFKFRKDSFYSEARAQMLGISPLKGILGAHSEQQVNITFHPVKMGEVNFKLKCLIEKMKKPLSLSITASCFELQVVVSYDSDDGSKVVLNSETVNKLEMKALVPYLKQTVTFNISNIGLTGLYYSWIIKEDAVSHKVKIAFSDAKGYIKSKDEAIIAMNVTPVTKIVIKKLLIKLQINYGPTYVIHLTGSAAQPLFTFSDDEYNFGPCLIQKEDTSYYKKVIEFSNNDETSATLECKMPDQDYLSTNFRVNQIEPKKSEQIVFAFHPRETKRYYAEVEFYVNSKLKHLKIHGEGVLCLVELLNPKDKFVNLGCVPAGQTVTKAVTVVNNSATSVDIIFDLYDRLPYFSKPKKVLPPEFEIEDTASIEKKVTPDKKNAKGNPTDNDKGKGKESKDNKKSDKDKNSKNEKANKGAKKGSPDLKGEVQQLTPVETAADKEQKLIRQFVTFVPNKFVKIKPQKSRQFFIKYSPMERMKTFSEKVFYQVQDNIDTVCVFKGCSTAPEFTLEKDCIAFGSVIKGCFSKQKIVLHNQGDIGASFKWIFEKPQICFMITPKEGYIATGTSITFMTKFKPTQISCLLQAKVRCVIEGYSKQLELALSGSCFDMPPAKEMIKFTCPVRRSDRKLITINNPTSLPWEITPTINGQYYFAPEIFIVEPKSSKSCEVTYKPLTMTIINPHEATIFFNLPEGQGLLYELTGTAEAPLCSRVISRDVTCKTYHNEVLTVANWLKVPQKLSVITENTMPNTAVNRTLYKLTGNTIIDILPQSEKDYTWTIFVLNEGVLKLKVIFKNNDTQEYQFYEIVLNVLKPPVLDVIHLSTCVRVPVTHTLTIQNPIKYPVVYTVQSSLPELSIESPFTVEPYCEYQLVIKYKPLLIRVIEARVEIVTKELGNYPYEFILTGHPPIPEPYVHFATCLGQVATQKAPLFNESNSNIEFIPEMEHPDIFYLEKPVTIPSKQRGEFTICFEPNAIGNVQSSLTLCSPLAGSYIYPLIATCSSPKPQGPYFIKPGGNATIQFKNPFEDEKTFDFAVEPAIFSTKLATEEIKGRKDIKVVVNLLPLKNLEILIDQKYPITGKLTVCCNELQLPPIKWIYYLQGDLSV